MMASLRLLGAALGLAALAGCASLQPIADVEPGSPLPSGRPSAPSRPAPVDTSTVIPVPNVRAPVPVGTTASGGTIRSTASTAAVVDSSPSRDALRVLDSIPEPLPVAERVAAPTRAGVSAPAPEAAYDTLRTPGPSAADGDGVPVPSPTQPLGERPGERRAVDIPDSLLAAIAAGARDTAAGAPAAPDTCWRVQFGAPDARPRAEALRAAAESQLLVPVVIEIEKKLHKVRTRDCLTRDAADRLAARAKATGLAGSFRFQGKRP
jgi:hypothetical protein